MQRNPFFLCQTLGLRLDTTQEIALFRHGEPIQGKPIRRFTDYAKALLTAIMNQQEKQHLKSDDWQRTVYINTLDVGTTDFDISDDEKAALVEQGIQGTETYLHWFENTTESPANRLGQAHAWQPVGRPYTADGRSPNPAPPVGHVTLSRTLPNRP